jgi:hypothetical protein
MISLTCFCSFQAVVIFCFRSSPIPETSSNRSGVDSITLKVSSLKSSTMRSAKRGPIPLIISEPRYPWIPATVAGKVCSQTSALNCGPCFGWLSHCPCRRRCSPGESSGKLPTTVANPSAFRLDLLVKRFAILVSGRSLNTVYPFSAL